MQETRYKIGIPLPKVMVMNIKERALAYF